MALAMLVSSAGRRVELLRCFRADAAALGVELSVVAVDVDPRMSAACQEADVALAVPPCTEPSFTERMLEICRLHGIDLVVPTIDTELETLAAHADAFAEAGAHVVVSSAATVALARDKLATARWLAGHGIPVPRTASIAEIVRDAAAWTWPVILKPRRGSSSAGLVICESPAALAHHAGLEGYVGQEYVRGEEYTVNLYFDRAHRLRCAVPHLRHEVRAGEVSKGVSRRHQGLDAIARSVGQRLPGPLGPLCFQAVAGADGSLAVLEINARFGGGFPLAHRAGARFTRWLLEEQLGLPLTASDDWSEGVVMLRYDAAIFR
jgi:carbamoyl-phosphate synthase large subunit